MTANIPQQGPAQPTSGPQRPGGFFNSIRYSSWFRANDRVIGGVCAGISARTGWDVGLVRGLTVVLALFFPPVLIAYGVCWALLPEQQDGRIHLEQLVHGRFDVAQLGAAAFVLLGLGNPGPRLIFRGNSWSFQFFALIVGILLIALVFYLARRSQGPRIAPSPITPHTTGAAPMTGTPPQPNPGQPQQQPQANIPPTQAMPTQPAPQWQPGQPYAVRQPQPQPRPQPMPQAAPYQPGPTQQWVAPATPAPIPHISKPITISVIGLLFLILAGMIGWNIHYHGHGVLQATGTCIAAAACLVIVGAALVGSALRGKRAVTLIVLSAIGMSLWPFAIIGAANTQSFGDDWHFDAVSVTNVGPATIDWADENYGDWTGPLTIDLTGAPAGEDHFVHVYDGTGPIEILVLPDQPVKIGMFDVTGTLSSEDHVSGGDLDWVGYAAGNSMDQESQTPNWKGHGVTVSISDVTGPVTVRQVDDTTGSTDTDPAQSAATGSGTGSTKPGPTDTSQSGH